MMTLTERLKSRKYDQDCQDAAALIDELEGELEAASEWVESLKAEIADLQAKLAYGRTLP